MDPGTQVTGYGVVDVVAPPALGRLVECGTIALDRHDPLAKRLRHLHDGIAELIDRHHPDSLALENAFFRKNAHSALVLGHARGVVMLAAARADIEVFEYPPATIKQTVSGAGAARKSQVAAMVARLLRLSSIPQPSDAADGVAVALTHILRA